MSHTSLNSGCDVQNIEATLRRKWTRLLIS
jgi:hypothetical protein